MKKTLYHNLIEAVHRAWIGHIYWKIMADTLRHNSRVCMYNHLSNSTPLMNGGDVVVRKVLVFDTCVCVSTDKSTNKLLKFTEVQPSSM